jgi:hypothetical protein
VKNLRDINEALIEHYHTVSQYYPRRILGVFAHGSMNYGLFNENSDVDTIVIVLPTKEDIVMRKDIHQEIELQNGEIAKCIDILSFCQSLIKGDINNLMCLYTDYNLIPEDKRFWFNWFFINRDSIKSVNPVGTLNCAYGNMRHYLKTYWNTDNPKYLVGARRLAFFIEDYKQGFDFKTCISYSGKEDREAHFDILKIEMNDNAPILPIIRDYIIDQGCLIIREEVLK